MDFELSQPSIFPVDTDVGAYPASAVPDRTAAPTGRAVDTQRVADGKVTFTGLSADVSYYAGAEVSRGVWRYVHFTPGTPGVDLIASTDDNETVTGNWDFQGDLTHGGSGRLGFFGETAVAQPARTDDIKDALVALGLLEAGGATPLDLDGGAAVVGDLTHEGTKAGFFGATADEQSAVLTAEREDVVDRTYGDEEAAVLENVRTRVGEIEAALVRLGLIAAA